MPVIGNLFKGKTNSDNLDELLVFITKNFIMINISRESEINLINILLIKILFPEKI